MSTVARRFVASPVRLSSAVWRNISNLIAGTDAAALEFANVAGVASSLINDEMFANNPMVIKNKGPRLRVYCLYGDNAISEDDKNEDKLSWDPTAHEWHVFLPCSGEEFDEFTDLLQGKSNKFTVYNVEKGVPDSEPRDGDVGNSSAQMSANWDEFEKL